MYVCSVNAAQRICTSLSVHRCGPSSKSRLLFPLREASTVGNTLLKSGGLCLLQGLHYHTRDLPDRPTAWQTASSPKVKPLLVGAVDNSGQTHGLHGVPLFSGECVDSDGTSKQNQGEAVWALLSHGALAQWIRLMLAHEGGCCNAAFSDRRWWIRALSGPMSTWETQWWGKEGGRREIRAQA